MNRPDITDIHPNGKPLIEFIDRQDSNISMQGNYGVAKHDKELMFFSFKLVLDAYQSNQSLQIKHAWFFKTSDGTFMKSPTEELAYLFSYFVTDTIKICNTLVSGGGIHFKDGKILDLCKIMIHSNLN